MKQPDTCAVPVRLYATRSTFRAIELAGFNIITRSRASSEKRIRRDDVNYDGNYDAPLCSIVAIASTLYRACLGLRRVLCIHISRYLQSQPSALARARGKDFFDPNGCSLNSCSFSKNDTRSPFQEKRAAAYPNARVHWCVRIFCGYIYIYMHFLNKQVEVLHGRDFWRSFSQSTLKLTED